ncbi:proton channel OtopLc isoform X9 [Atheta coriaria]|uniref:proton channel OtopLc isoform X9 n=1 Tax=Dalotia coriaria TaxID=877792 RepID=UPI0031F3389E
MKGILKKSNSEQPRREEQPPPVNGAARTFESIPEEREEQQQQLQKCKVKIYKLSTTMQRCPYIYEMKERLLGEQQPQATMPEVVPAKKVPTPPPLIIDYQYPQQPVATVVKLNADGYGSHTSPTHKRGDRTPLMHHSPQDEFQRCYDYHHMFPKNAKTSLFIIMSFVYMKLLVVVCVAYVISDVVTHNIPLWYYEGFFTYLYGVSILFLLYVFCFLLQESSCCSGEKKEKAETKKALKEKAKAKELEKKKEEKQKKLEEKEKKKEEKEKEKAEKKKDKDKDKKKDKKGDKRREVYPRKMRDLVQARAGVVPYLPVKSTYRRNSEGVVDAGLSGATPPTVPVPVEQLQAQSEPTVLSQESGVVASDQRDLEAGVKIVKRKRKTTQNDQSHGSFFLRIGAIAFGLGTMIYNGLEFGTFFEVPISSPCYMILRGINPVLQMIFTFMQMYFIFMNSRLNIHRFKVIARFGLMHVVATNICVWVRTVVLEYLKEVTLYHKLSNNSIAGYPGAIRDHTVRNAQTILGSHMAVPDTFHTTTTTTVSPVAEEASNAVVEDIIASNEGTLYTGINGSELLDNLTPQAWWASSYNASADVNNSLLQASCGRINIMGNIVQDSAPYLFPFIIEYSLIGAVVIYVMWKHIGRNPRYYNEEDLEHRLEVMLSRRAVAMAHAQNGRVDCVGASKGLFFGLLLLVGSLICLILFFVLISQKTFEQIALYLGEVSHCVLMTLSILAIIIGFCRVRSLKFKIEEASDLNDILLRISAFGLFLYATFSVIAGSLNALTEVSNLLVMVTGILSIVQVVLQLLFIGDVSRRRVHLPEHDRSKPGRQVVTFLLICNITMWIIYTFETQKVERNPIQLEFYGFLTWALIQRLTLPLCIFHRFHSAVTLAEIWKTSYKARLE